MSETVYEVGDLVEIEQGEEFHRGRVYDVGSSAIMLRVPGAPGLTPHELTLGGWIVTVAEKSKPPVVLPTEPGVYIDATSGLWRFTQKGYLALQANGSAGWFGADHLRELAPFTRLEPVAETAKKVLDRLDALDSELSRASCSMTKGHILTLAAEFGVTS